MSTTNWRSRGFALLLVASLGGLAAGCEDQLAGGSGRSLRPISSETLAQMTALGTTPTAPVLIRTYKKEAEFEIWKMKADGQYALLKTFPMCRWSGQLGPKTREGDRQVPEGFYAITPGQMNPNSNYYLSFNVGYPNAYDRAFGRGGGTIMVHGACSSAGCFSMTDAQIAEIYAIAREGFNGGQREIQMQSYPFRMTAENLAKHRLDLNIDFWKQLKTGSDHFDVAHREPAVAVCGKRYVFDAVADGPMEAGAPCPALRRDEGIEAQVAQKQSHDDAEIAELVAKGLKPVRLVYWDGGQNAAFAGRGDSSRPEAVGAPQEIAMDESTPAVVKVAAASAQAQRPPSVAIASVAIARTPVVYLAALPAATAEAGTAYVKSLLRLGGDETATAFVPQTPAPSDVPLPPERGASVGAASEPLALRVASLKAPAKPRKPLEPLDLTPAAQ